MKSRPLSLGLAVLFTSLLVAAAPAQLRELMSTRDGDGSLTFRSRSSSSNVDRVTVRLERNGDAFINVDRGARESFEGRWQNDGNRRVRVLIDRVGRDRADGLGQILLDGRGSFTSIRLSGDVGRSRFEFEFSAGKDDDDRPNRPNRPGDLAIDALNVAPRGQGSLDFRARSSSSDFRMLRVRLNRDHSFEIRPDGIGETFRGRWWQDERGSIRLDTDRVNNDSATGTGSIEMESRGVIRRVNMSGNVGRAAYRLNFDTRPEQAGGGDFDDFRDAARRAVEREFSSNTSFQWWDENVGSVTFGNRTVTGKVRARGGNRPGTYTYRVVLGAGTGNVKSVSVTRD